MDYNYPLLKAEVSAAYNDLIIDARLKDGQTVTAFCGAVEAAEMCTEGTPVWLKRTSVPNRLIKYNISFIQTPQGLVFANPKYNRTLFYEAFEKGLLSDFKDYVSCCPLWEKEDNGIDFELTDAAGGKAFVFVTSTYHKQDACAVFPHSINFFELKLFEEFQKRYRAGAKTYVVMIVPREDCVSARFVWNLDPQASAAIFEAAKNGLNFLCYGCKLERNKIEINRKMEILYK